MTNAGEPAPILPRVRPGASERPHLPALDGLRGVAVLLVLVLHFAKYDGPRSHATDLALRLLAAGWVGVDLFFVLSGFLITGILLDARGGRGYFRNFYARRTLRVFPLYYTVLFLVFVVLPATGAARHVAGFDSLRATQGWLWTYGTNLRMAIDGRYSFNAPGLYLSHFWSLAIEEHFYLAWPLIVFSFRRRTVALVAAGAVCAGPLIRCLLLRHGANDMTLYVLTPCRMDGLAMGSLLALLAASPRVGLRRLVAPAWTAMVAGVAVFAWWFHRKHELDAFDYRMQQFGYTAVSVFFAAVLVLAVRAPGATKLLSARWLRSFGKYSYGLYVLHAMAIPWLFALYPADTFARITRSAAAGVALTVALSTATVFAVAWVSYNGFERHFLKLKRYFEYRS